MLCIHIEISININIVAIHNMKNAVLDSVCNVLLTNGPQNYGTEVVFHWVAVLI